MIIRIDFTVLTCLVVCAAALLPAASQELALKPLGEISWPLQERVESGAYEPIAISLRAEGKRIDLNYKELSAPRQQVYTDPLGCAAAAITARINVDEAWWGDLTAGPAERGPDGVPAPDYHADSESNLFSMLTYHQKSPQVPQVVDAMIVSYLRVGGAHVFDVRWSRVLGEVEGPPASSGLMIQEFSPGKFRVAPEWMKPGEPVYALLRNTEIEDATAAAYRAKENSLSRRVSITGLYGGEGSEYPLDVQFRGIAADQSPEIERVLARKATIAEKISEKREAFTQSGSLGTQETLAPFFTKESLRRYKQQGQATQLIPPFYVDTKFVIDAGGLLLAFGIDGKTLSPRYATFVEQDGNLVLANYARETLLMQFIADDRVWTPLSQAMEAIIGTS